MDQGFDISVYTGALRRRVGTILAVFLTGSVLSAGVAYVLPSVYESTAKILVETQQIPDRLAESTVTASVAERLELIEQRLMTRENLLEIIERLGLFADLPRLSPTEKVDLVRKSTRFENFSFVDNPRHRSPTQVSAFTITYSAGSSALAARVTNEFVTLVLEQNLQSRTARAAETHRFFKGEVERIAAELLALEAEIAAYKNAHGDALPESYEFRLTELTGLEERRIERERRRAQLEDQRRVLEEALEEGTLPTIETVPKTPEERELAELRRALVQRRSILRDTHPEIVALQARIAALEASISLGGDPTASPAPDAPVDLRRRQIEIDIDLIGKELASLAEQDAAAATRIAALRASIQETPAVEQALNAFQRRYASLQVQYEAAVAKLADAEIGLQLETNRQAERFEVIEQAIVPERPVKPKRKAIALGGAAASLGLGIALALLLELVNASIRTGADLQRSLGLSPVVTVPYIRTRGERRRRALGWLVRLLLVGGGIALALWAVDQYYMPLEVLFDQVLEKSGLERIIRMIQARLG